MTQQPPRVIVDDDDHEHVVNLHGRSLRRTALLAIVIAGIVAFGGMRAEAAPSSGALGVATMTSQRDCPGGLKVMLSLLEEQGSQWSLVAQPVHTECTFRTDLPLRFAGAWDETGAQPCDLATGARCFEGVDRPGRIALGGAAVVRGLIEVPITYARGTVRLHGTALLWRLV